MGTSCYDTTHRESPGRLTRPGLFPLRSKSLVFDRFSARDGAGGELDAELFTFLVVQYLRQVTFQRLTDQLQVFKVYSIDELVIHGADRRRSDAGCTSEVCLRSAKLAKLAGQVNPNHCLHSFRKIVTTMIAFCSALEDFVGLRHKITKFVLIVHLKARGALHKPYYTFTTFNTLFSVCFRPYSHFTRHGKPQQKNTILAVKATKQGRNQKFLPCFVWSEWRDLN